MNQVKLLNIDNDFMGDTKRAFKFMAWNPFNVGSQEMSSSKWIFYLRSFYMFITNFYIIFGFILEAIYCIDSIGKPDAFLKITNTAPILGFVVMSVAKAYGVVYKNRKKLNDIVIRLDKLFPKTIQEQVKFNVHQYATELKLKTTGFIILNISGIWIYNLTPMLIQLYGIVFEGHFYEKKLPTVMWYWFDPFQPGIYESLYVLICWTGFTIALTILATDLLFCSIITLLSMQFKIVSENVRNHHGDLEKLKDLVKVHQELVELSDAVEDIFSPSFLLNVFSSSFVICLTGFQAVTISGQDHFNLIRYILLLSPSLVEIFLLCHFAEKLIESSGEVAEAAYDNIWYENGRSKAYKKCLLQIMVKAQQSQVITAYKFMEMSLATFSTIMENSYSYFTILRTLYG